MNFQNRLIERLIAFGDDPAIEQGGKTITYSELLNTADRVTHFLLERQLEKETMVGIMLEDRVDIICSVIGVMNARCIFVLLDPSLPEHRLNQMTEDMHLQYVVTSDGLPGSIRKKGLQVQEQFIFREISANRDPERLMRPHYPGFDGEDSLYIYFTSGSTGMPKGIIGKNSSLLQFVEWEIDCFRIERGTRFSQFVSPYFDAFLRDVFVPLLSGGTICIPPQEEGLFLPETLISWIGDRRIAFIHCVPSLFRAMNTDSLSAQHFNSLRYILLSGEKINPPELLSWYEKFNDRIQLVNLYGTTETTMIRAFYRIVPADAKQSRIPIGFPISDTELFIANKDLKPCNKLVTGDLYIVSDHITKGYLNAPELTKEKFIRLDTGDGKLKKAFRTGDKARMLADGRIELLGREDRQIKLRGIRVEPDEIESVLVGSGLVRTAVVIARTDDKNEMSLAAFIIRNTGIGDGESLSEDILQFLSERLPGYMVPSQIVEVQEYPLTATGKIDHRTLASRIPSTEIIAPANETELKLLSIWKEVLGEKAISIKDSFHKMGGNSLTIMKLIAKIYKEYNIRISLSDLFNNLTIERQAELIRVSKKDLQYIIPAAAAKPAYRVSSSQERMYYNQELRKESTSYNLPMAWQIAGEYDEAKIERCFRRLIDRHEALRTEFRVVNGELMQFIRDKVDLNITLIPNAGEDQHDLIAGFIQPFDLGKAPLMRCGIIDGSPGKKILVVDFHHIICDGMSQMTLLSDFLKLYNGEEPALPALRYIDYAEWEYAFRSTKEYLSHREFWLRLFEGEIPEIDLPTTNSAIDDSSDTGGSIDFQIQKEVMAGLAGYLKEEGITEFAVLFTFYLLFLCQLAGQEDIVIGIATSGRMQIELENVVGMFVKTLPVRCRLDPMMSFRKILKEVNGLLIQANSHQVYDLTNIVIDLNKNRVSPIGRLFDVVLVFQNYEEEIRNDGPGRFTVLPVEHATSKYPMTLFAGDRKTSFDLKMEYLSGYFIKADVELLISQFHSLVESFSANPDARIIDIIGNSMPQAGFVQEEITFNF